MKHGKLILIMLLSVLVFVDKVNAECDYKTELEINTSAANVETNLDYETKIVGPDGNEHPEAVGKTNDVEGFVQSTFINLNITNITDNIYLNITNDDDNLNQNIYASDTVDGTYQYAVPDTSIIRTYTIKIFSNVNDCMDNEIRTIEVKTPMYNELYGTDICKNNNSYYCSEYVTVPIDYDKYEFSDEQNSSSKKGNNIKNNNSEKKYLVFYLVGIVIILIIIVLIIIEIIKIKRRKDNIMRNSL